MRRHYRQQTVESMKFFKFDPNLSPDEGAVLEAASLLDTTEYRVFNLAFERWYGHRAEPDAMEEYFAAYMFRSVVPLWTRHFTREVLRLARIGKLRRADYGIRELPLSPRMLRRGRFQILLIIVACALLLVATLLSEELLKVAHNCYFPPCY